MISSKDFSSNVAMKFLLFLIYLFTDFDRISDRISDGIDRCVYTVSCSGIWLLVSFSASMALITFKNLS